MARKIKGNHDGPNGRNDSNFIPGRGQVPRSVLVPEVRQGKHEDFSTYQRGGQTYVRAKPDNKKGNNVNN